MFSNKTRVRTSTALRNPRRRQRTASGDSDPVEKVTKRLKRSGLTAETFKPISTDAANGHLHGDDAQPTANGHVRYPGHPNDAEADQTNSAIRRRGSRKPDRERRGYKGDGSVELTKNDTYAVTRLATTPPQLQQHRSSEIWRGEISTSMGYAVATTQRHALVWRYKQGAHATDSSKPLVIRLLHTIEESDQFLPLGILIPSSPEPGLLIVMPVSGKVTYWESLSSAANMDLGRQKQQAINGTVTGLAHGEHISSITEAEPQGFLLTASSGKVVHLTIADLQGRASINAQMLRSNSAQASGIFGSLRNVFGGGGWLKDLAAVKAGNSTQRGQRHCVIGTTKGLLQLWDLNWNGAHSLRYEVDAKPKLLDSIRDTGTFPRDSTNQYFKVLDLAYLPAVVTGQEVTSLMSKSATRLLILTVLSSPKESRYNLHVLDIVNETIEVPVVHSITCYTTLVSDESSSKPQLLIPEPGQTAYIIFERSIVLVSLEEIEESPSSQLQTEARRVPDPFQDVIDFHKNKGYRVVGCAADIPEKGHRGSGCTIMVQGYGVIRVSVAPMEDGLTSEERVTINAQTKLEQAVFYGSQQSLLDFSSRPEVQFATEDVQDAALRISRSITDSSSKYLSVAGPSMEHQLQRRAIALDDLIKHLGKHYQRLDQTTRWRLLWDAEKLAAAKAIWRAYEAAPKGVPEGEKILLDEIVECISEEEKAENQPEHHETDAVRHWLVHDVWRLETLIPWTSCGVTLLYNESVEDRRPMSLAYRARLISEANDVQLMAMETAYNFRQNNVSLYCFDEDTMVEGLLDQGYTGMPEIWTSTALICDAVQNLAVYFQNFAIDVESNPDDEGSGPSAELFEKIALENARLVDLSCKTHLERSRWLQASDDPGTQKQGQDLEQESSLSRRDLLKGLVDIGQYSSAINLGEKYRDLEALAEVLESEIRSSQEDLEACSASHEATKEIRAKISICERCVDNYFEKYGTAWADAFFTRFVDQGRISSLLVHGPKQRQYLTSFLRAHRELSSFSWINEVNVENDYAAAANDLQRAQKQADNVWAKKMQLSMAKLATLTGLSNQQGEDDKATRRIEDIDKSMEVLAAQDQLLQTLRPTLRRALNDTSAKTELLMETYGKRFVKAKTALRKALEQNFVNVLEEKVLDTEELVDTISLLDEDSLDPSSDFAVSRFLTALRLVRLCSFEIGEIARKELLDNIIWRRCIIQDDWPKINRTELKDDTKVEEETGATALFKTLREGFKSGFWDDYPPLAPSALLAAGTTIDSLRTSSRYTNLPDSALAGIARDLEIEDKALETCIEEGRLDQWWIGIVEAAKLSARNQADRVGEERSKRAAREQEFREEMERVDRAVWGVGEEAVEAGGMRVGGMDEEGDVVMGM
ncbi:MAG: hypothetical protein Q9181_000275 [Wetmoreana brouardii]